MSVLYKEFPASAAIQPFVARLWSLEVPAGFDAVDPVLPDGHAEIIVHCGHPFAEPDVSGTWRTQARVLCAGQTQRAVHLRPTGPALVVGATLRPHGAAALLRTSQHELTDRIVEIAAVNRRLATIVHEEMAGRHDATAAMCALDRALRRAARHAAIDPLAERVVTLAMTRRALVSVGELASTLDLSARRLERLFRDHVGLSPKQFLRVHRFQRVLKSLREEPDVEWADLAIRHGFYDQSHFVNDFKSFTGQPPSAWDLRDDSLTAVFGGRTLEA